jgi:hypothetical protein
MRRGLKGVVSVLNANHKSALLLAIPLRMAKNKKEI